MDRGAHFQYPAVDPGIGELQWAAKILDRQIGRHDDGKPRLVTLIDDGVDLFLRVIRRTLDSQVVDDQEAEAGKGGDVAETFLAVQAAHLVQHFREIRHKDRYPHFEERVRDAGGGIGFSRTDIAPEEQSEVLCFDPFPVLHVILCHPDDRRILCFCKCPLTQMPVLNAGSLHPCDLIQPVPFRCLPFFPFDFFFSACAEAGNDTFPPHEDDPALGGFVALTAVAQAVPAGIFVLRRRVCCSDPSEQCFLNSVHRLSPSLYRYISWLYGLLWTGFSA